MRSLLTFDDVIYRCLFVILLIATLLSSATAQRHCGLAEQVRYWRQADPAGWQTFHQPIAPSSIPRTEMTIPVVVHVVHHSEEENISDFQIKSQIEVLNRIFDGQLDASRQALDIHGDVFDVPDISFALACRAPDGSPTDGITRTATPVADIGFRRFGSRLAVHHDDLGGKAPWPVEDYLNIWVCAFEGDILGRASLPGPLEDPQSDGLTIDYRYFGYAGAVDSDRFDLGMTAVHELGHYLGLFHPWGRRADCSSSDFIDDTPDQSEIYYGCPDEHARNMSCGSIDMVRNIMGYADDACLTYFTQQQTMRMASVLNNQRAGLLRSDGLDDCIPRSTSIDQTNIWHDAGDNSWVFDFDNQRPRRLTLYDMMGKTILHATLPDPDFLRYELNNIAAGLYIIHLEDASGKLTRRMLSFGFR